MLKTSTSLFFAVISIIGCAPSAATTNVPAVPLSASAPVDSPRPSATPAPAPSVVALEDAAVPVAGACDEPTPADDPRCPSEVLLAAALSYLDTTVAQFDGTYVEAVEYDPEDVLSEARADPRFRQILAAADVEPTDGRLGPAEAREAERQVLEIVDARYAAVTQTP